MFCELLFAFQATRPLHFLNLRLFRSFRFTQFLAGTMRIHHHDWTNEKNHCKKYKPNNGQRRVVALFHHPLYFHLGECLIFFVRLSVGLESDYHTGTSIILNTACPADLESKKIWICGTRTCPVRCWCCHPLHRHSPTVMWTVLYTMMTVTLVAGRP